MDAPIYIRFASIDVSSELPPISVHKLFVIEESDGKTSAAGGNENERVTILNLPDSPLIRSPSVAVAKSRLFIVGGDYRDHSERVFKFNGIQSVNLKDDSLSWEVSPLDEDRPAAFAYVGGTAVSDDCSLIYGLGLRGNIYSFDPETRTLQFHYKFVVPAPNTSLPRLLAFTDNKLYVNCASEDEANLLGYFDIKSLSWHNIGILPRLVDLQTTVVLVRDRYLISFGLWHPVNDEFCPALYVYDIQHGLWLPEPVQGLPNDGTILPSLGMPLHYRPPIDILSVMQVRRDELKLALVWCISDNEQNEFHLSKFTLTIQEHGYLFPHTFRAESLSSVSFSATGVLLDVNSVTA